MFAHVHTPLSLTPAQLDDYLSRGWFRMGQNIFTTNFLNFKGQFYSALWLRVDLQKYSADNTEVKLRKQNARFTIRLNKAAITAEKEELFLKYRASITFEASASIHQLLFGKVSYNIFDSYEVTVYDKDKLIACGFFDMGLRCSAGITSFYDPAYKKYSLGKFLIYQKINFCRELNQDYFYPGYFVPGYSFFDYKLSIGKKALQFLDYTSEQWCPIARFTPLLTPIRIMQEKLNSLQIMLAQAKIEVELLRYEFFEANLLPELKDVELFDFPLFLHLPSSFAESSVAVVVYDIREEVYRLVRCRSLWNSNLPNLNGMYSSELLKQDHLVFSGCAEEMVAAFADELKKSIDIS